MSYKYTLDHGADTVGRVTDSLEEALVLLPNYWRLNIIGGVGTDEEDRIAMITNEKQRRGGERSGRKQYNIYLDVPEDWLSKEELEDVYAVLDRARRIEEMM